MASRKEMWKERELGLDDDSYPDDQVDMPSNQSNGTSVELIAQSKERQQLLKELKAMTDKADQYQAQNAVNENLIQILQDIISEQEEKIETLENHIKGRVRTHPNPAKPSSIAKLFDAVQVAHKETNRINQMWLDADNERVKFKTQVSQLEKKLREAKTFIVQLQTASRIKRETDEKLAIREESKDDPERKEPVVEQDKTSIRPPSKGPVSTEDVMDLILTSKGPYITSARVRTSFTARIRPNVKVIETAMKQLQKAGLGSFKIVDRLRIFYKGLPSDQVVEQNLARFGISLKIYEEAFQENDTKLSKIDKILSGHPFFDALKVYQQRW